MEEPKPAKCEMQQQSKPKNNEKVEGGSKGKKKYTNTKKRKEGKARRDLAKIVFRHLPCELTDPKLFEQGIKTLTDKAEIPPGIVRVTHFSPGKISRRRGLIPGVGYITCSQPSFADTICSLLPQETPFLLEAFQPQTTELPLPSPSLVTPSPSSSFGRAPPPVPNIRPLEHVNVNASVAEITATRAIYPKNLKSQGSNKRDKFEGTIGSDPDYLKFLERLNAPKVKLPSADVTNEKEKEAREKAAGSTLVAFLVKQAASRRATALSQSLSRRGLPSRSSSSKQGGPKQTKQQIQQPKQQPKPQQQQKLQQTQKQQQHQKQQQRPPQPPSQGQRPPPQQQQPATAQGGRGIIRIDPSALAAPSVPGSNPSKNNGGKGKGGGGKNQRRKKGGDGGSGGGGGGN